VGRNNAGEITSFKREEKVHNRLSPKCIKRCRRYRSADTDGQTWLTRNVIFQLESHIEGILQFKSRDPSQSALLLSSDSQTVCMACRCPDVCSKLLTLVEVAVFFCLGILQSVFLAEVIYPAWHSVCTTFYVGD
jgi:hypothetical protein